MQSIAAPRSRGTAVEFSRSTSFLYALCSPASLPQSRLFAECIDDPRKPATLECHDVEPARRHRPHAPERQPRGKKRPRSGDQPVLLAHVDTGERPAIVAAIARPNLDEYDRAVGSPHDEIDFPTPIAYVARNQRQAVAAQIAQRMRLEDVTHALGHRPAQKVVRPTCSALRRRPRRQPTGIGGRAVSWHNGGHFVAHRFSRGIALIDPLALAETQHYPAPALYVVATPIGNVADITVRALHVLALVDRIAAEDTRNTAQLLARYRITRPLLAVHKHNEREAAQRIVDLLRTGERIAYVSDAGTPGVSDPGARLVDAVRDAGFAIVPIPGASAVTTVLSATGNWAGMFTFVGFLPAKPKQRTAQLQALASHEEALVFYEAPHRVLETVRLLAETLGPSRRMLIAREITKLHESLHRCTLTEGPAWLEADPNRLRGEFVLVVEGVGAPPSGDTHQHDAVLIALLAEVPLSIAVKLAVALTGARHSALYARALELKKD
ncbi:hypothetical protein DFQ28_010895 [Apophysomyces sp. BC1034]|nr:hypothetical protein DFQ28_010895 [Apophysomyces sp. BC1034]